MRKLFGVLPSFLAGALGGVVAISIMGASSPKGTPQAKTIQADRIKTNLLEIVDPNSGKTVIELIGKTQILDIKDPTNEARVMFCAQSTPSMWMFDGNGKPRLFMTEEPTGTPSSDFFLALYDSSGKERTRFQVGESPGITLKEATGRERIVIGQTDLVNKASGVKEVTLPGSVTIFDEVGNVVWKAPH